MILFPFSLTDARNLDTTVLVRISLASYLVQYAELVLGSSQAAIIILLTHLYVLNIQCIVTIVRFLLVIVKLCISYRRIFSLQFLMVCCCTNIFCLQRTITKHLNLCSDLK